MLLPDSVGGVETALWTQSVDLKSVEEALATPVKTPYLSFSSSCSSWSLLAV